MSKLQNPKSEGTLKVKRIAGTRRMKVSADGQGVVSHAGVGMLGELAERTGLVAGLSKPLLSSYKAPPTHQPGQVLTDLAVAVADGAINISGIQTLTHRQEVFGPVASMPTAWRVLDRVTDQRLPQIRGARAAARQAAWKAGAGPEPGAEAGPLVIDVDATITIAHSEKDNAAATWKKTFGYHPLLAFLDRPEIAGGEALAGILRPGNSGSNTAADHITVLDQALEALPADVRPGGQASGGVLVRSDSAGATRAFARRCREAGVEFSFGYGIHTGIQDIVDEIPELLWQAAINTDASIREGAWVVEATDYVDLSAWPAGTRLILRKERPHPGAQLSFADADGMRVTGFITDTGPRVVDHQIAGLELRHRQHARVEDRIRQAKAAGLANLPSRHFDENQAWLQVVMIAADLIAWTKLIAYRNTPQIARCEIQAFRYMILHAAARITRGARQIRLRIDATWKWAGLIAAGYQRLREAFP